MAGGGTYRADQVKFAYAEEAIDGTVPATVASSPGVIKGGITLPDVEYEWDMFYGVDRNGRGRKNAHLGNQSFIGSIPQIYFLFEGSRGIMELILGELSDDIVSLAVNPGVIDSATDTTMTDAANSFESGLGVKDGNYAVFSGISVGYIENESGTADTVVTVWPTPAREASGGSAGWNGPRPLTDDKYEIRKTESVGVGNTDKFIVPTQHLNTMTWAVQHRNSTAHGAASCGSFLTVNYMGGKVNRATLSARQGEKLMISLDEVIFRELSHSSQLPAGTTPAKYDADTVVPSATHPTEEPMVFSQGTLSLFELGNSFAKIRDFSLSINNNITMERYVSTTTLNGNTVITQIPHELTEGNREVQLTITAIMETLEYWEHLMRQGQNDTLTGKTGFDVQLKFQANAAGTEFFYIQGPAFVDPVIIADSSKPINTTQAQSTTANVGCVILTAPHEIPGEGNPLIEVRLTLDVPNLVMWYRDS
jgi:hypothetical protein